MRSLGPLYVHIKGLMSGRFILVSGPGKTRKQCNTQWLSVNGFSRIQKSRALPFDKQFHLTIVGRSCAAPKDQKECFPLACVCARPCFIRICIVCVTLNSYTDGLLLISLRPSRRHSTTVSF